MPVSARDKKGRATASVDTEDLYALVRVIAQSADPKAPERVTQRKFDAAREPSGHLGVPKATTICARLADRNGRPMPWREVLERALDEGASPEHAERQRLSEPDAAYLDVRHVIYALRLVATRRSAKSFTPDEYAEERRAILATEGRRRNLRRNLQAELLPTVGQIEVIVRDRKAVSGAPWDKALALAKLEARSTLRKQRFHRGRHPDSLPLVEAIHHYVEANGELPSKEDFEEFRRLANIKVEARRGAWKDLLQAAIEYRKVSGSPGRPSCRRSPADGEGERGRSRSRRTGFPAPPRVLGRVGANTTRMTASPPSVAISRRTTGRTTKRATSSSPDATVFRRRASSKITAAGGCYDGRPTWRAARTE